MKNLVLLAACLLPNVSCADSADESATKSIRSSDNYVMAESFGVSADLDKRLSLISKGTERYAYVLMGDDEPFVFALAASENFFKVEGNTYSYISPENALLFRQGPNTGTSCNGLAELLLFTTGEAVGQMEYGCNGYPSRPYRMLSLCTNEYEKVCSIRFDKTKKVFAIEMLPPQAN